MGGSGVGSVCLGALPTGVGTVRFLKARGVQKRDPLRMWNLWVSQERGENTILVAHFSSRSRE